MRGRLLACENRLWRFASYLFGYIQGLINTLDTEAKCRHLKIFLPLKGLCGRCLSARGTLPSNDPIPPLHTVYLYTVYKFTQRRGEGGEELTREKVREGNSSQSWVENTNMTVSPV
jgi:hypothetical protein